VDIDEGEAAVRLAVQQAFDEFIARIKATVFADPGNPDWLVWPSDAWAELVARFVTPEARRVFEETLVEAGVVSPALVAGAAGTFVGQDLVPVVAATTIPDETQQRLYDAFIAGGVVAALALLVGSASLWAPMLGVMARNGGAAAVNAAQFDAARVFSDSGRRRVVKTWIAREDERTRLTHAAVDNTTVLVDDVFNVGGFPLRYPHDPFGPVGETVNCRCSLRFGEQNG